MTRNFWLDYSISVYHCFTSWLMPRIISDEKAVDRYYRKHTNGRPANMRDPQLFSEKLQWYKLNARMPLMEKVANKYTVREYIKECGYEHLLNELFGVYKNVSEIHFNELPNQFVLKDTHGSGHNIIVRDKKQLCQWKAKMMMHTWRIRV